MPGFASLLHLARQMQVARRGRVGGDLAQTMAAKREAEQQLTPVTLDYAALERGDDLSAKIEEAFGIDGLGILTVSGVPGLQAARSKLAVLLRRVTKEYAAR